MCTRVNTCLWYRSTLSTRPSSLFYTYIFHLWSEGIRVFNYSYIPDFQIFVGFYLCTYRSIECYNHSNAGALNSNKSYFHFFYDKDKKTFLFKSNKSYQSRNLTF